ncbi:g7784 [Coccomyxa viridis]|uniref:MLO-like protein n=1 Tax=Coccomyxa viridis TaxID=1274662 RepID=A0ABP1G165_9CHLO
MAGYYGDSILETPPGIVTMFFLLFLAATVVFELVLHGLELFTKKNRGLARALEKAKTELMLLGLCALLIASFSSKITSYCLPADVYASKYGKSWIDSVSLKDGCPCCLGRTDYISPCFLQHAKCGDAQICKSKCSKPQAKTCPANQGLASNSAVKLQKDGTLKEFKCWGKVQVGWDECKEASARPILGPNTLKQIDIFIFVIASMHVICSLGLILAVPMRLRLWCNAAQKDDKRQTLRQITERMHARDKSHECSIKTLESGSCWSHRPEEPLGWKESGKELLFCFLRLIPFGTVPKKDLWLLNASFHLKYGISGLEFDFMSFIAKRAGYDAADIVGLGFSMWITVIVYLLLSWKVGWCIWALVLLDGLLILGINMRLLWLLRYMTRGAQPHMYVHRRFCPVLPRSLHAYMHAIKFLLFLTSFIFANAIFFSAQFGKGSCFFSSKGFQPLPHVAWWMLMVITGLYLVLICWVTTPLFSLVALLGEEADAERLRLDLLTAEERLHFSSLPEMEKRGPIMEFLRSLWLGSDANHGAHNCHSAHATHA